MATTQSIASIIRSDFKAFVRYAFRKTHDEELGDQPYIDHMCFEIARLINGKTKRLLINLPPQHLKSYVGTICLAAYLLGINPRLRLIVTAYNEAFAESLCCKIRDMMQTAWYKDVFDTRIKEGHSRANDFATGKGGGVFATAATGPITGRTADFIIYDDPHEIGDWNNERKLALVRDNFNTIISRLHDKATGPVLVIAHRVAEDDLSAVLMKEKGWQHLRLALVAVRRQILELGHEKWTREKGKVLRPKAYPKAEVERLRRTQVSPPFALFYQQGLGIQAALKLHAEHFQSYAPHERPIGCPVVLSIDPGHGGGANASRSVIQAWARHNDHHYLIDQFCEQCDAEGLRSAFWFFARKYRPSIALIERTADGPALYASVSTRTQAMKLSVELIVPREAKAIRFNKHAQKIRSQRIMLPDAAMWRDAFVAEIVDFPGEFDDQVDALTQYLDFMDTNPAIPVRPPRESGIAVAFGSNFQRRY